MTEQASVNSSTLKQSLFVFVKGMLMGTADAVPGVSGGTIAFITGIYPRLIQSLSCANVGLLVMLKNGQWRQFWKTIDGDFLLPLFLGVSTALLSMARLVEYLLEHWSLYLWSGLFSLILVSAAFLLIKSRASIHLNLLWVVIGATLFYLLSSNLKLQLEPTLLMVFIASSISICAMLLPGISGSFLLIMMGLYRPTIEAINNGDALYISCFILGAITGLLSFSKLVRWLLSSYEQVTILFLIGALLGSLPSIWPWQFNGEPVSPFSIALQGDNMLMGCVLVMIVTTVLYLVIERIASRAALSSSQ